MPTSFLNLTTNTQASGSATTFLTWRLAQNDDSNSNATKIDLFAQNYSASVVALQTAISYAVNATEAATNNYIATVTGFMAYIDKKLINLMLDVTQTGTTTLNINALGTKSLYKIGNNGTAGNLDSGDLVAGRPNFFMYDSVGGYWLWVSGTSADQINIPTTTNTEILLGSASGIVGSGISASSIAPSTASYIVLGTDSVLTNERVLTAGSNINISSSASEVIIHNTGAAADGWIPVTIGSWAYASISTITVPAGASTKYSAYSKVKFTQHGVVKFGYIYPTSDTLLTLYAGSDYAIEDTATYPITNIHYSNASTPIGFPQRFAYTPSLGGSAWTVVGALTALGYFSINSGIAKVWISLAGATSIANTGGYIGLPIAPIRKEVSFMIDDYANPYQNGAALTTSAIYPGSITASDRTFIITSNYYLL